MASPFERGPKNGTKHDGGQDRTRSVKKANVLSTLSTSLRSYKSKESPISSRTVAGIFLESERDKYGINREKIFGNRVCENCELQNVSMA